MKRFLMICLLTGGVSLLSSWMIPDTTDATLYHISRANCANNESISYDPFFGGHWLWVNSWHKRNGVWQHCENDVNSGCTWNQWEWGNHNGGIHWGEGFSGGWFVRGHHWFSNNPSGYLVQFRQTWAVSCFSNP